MVCTFKEDMLLYVNSKCTSLLYIRSQIAIAISAIVRCVGILALVDGTNIIATKSQLQN